MRQGMWAAAAGAMLAAVAASFAQAAPKPGSVAFFQDLTERRAIAHVNGDRAFYEKWLSADFVMMGDNGSVSAKRAYIEAEFAASRPEGMKPFYSVSDFRVTALRKDLAIVSYLKTEGMKLGEQTFAAEARRLDTYALEEGQWRLVAMVASRVLKPPATMSLSAEKLADFAGRYSVSPGIESVITVAGDHLVDNTTGQPAAELWSVGTDRFFCPGDSPGARTSFRRNPDGIVISWAYTNGDQEIVAKKVD
jgi:hypothetical protein